MPKFYVTLAGSLQTRWGIEVEAATVEIAKAEALASAPTDSNFWKLGDEVSDVLIDDIETLADETKDIDLGRRELEHKYLDAGGDWGHHPIHTRELWKHCVTEEDTVSGYWDWVYDKVQSEDEPDEAH